MDSSRNIVKKLRESRILSERKDYEKYSRDELIKLAQGGDQLALELLMNSHKDFIKRSSSKYFLDTGDREDVIQTANIAFWNAVQSWNGSGDFEAYAGMIIKRKLVDEIRKEEAGKSQINISADSLDRPYGDDGEGGETTVGASIQSNSLSPEEEYLGRDGARKIMKFIETELSEVERKVILRYIEGYKVSEISEEENMKYKSVENAIMRVKNKLADYVKNVRESKYDKLSESIFTDEEKQVLASILSKIDEKKALKESLEGKDLEDYTDEDFHGLLIDLENEVEDIIDEIHETTSDDTYNDLLSRLDQIKSILNEYEDHITPGCAADLKIESVRRAIRRGEDTYPENIKKLDPYAEVGMSRSDFM